jgi:protein SCO1
MSDFRIRHGLMGVAGILLVAAAYGLLLSNRSFPEPAVVAPSPVPATPAVAREGMGGTVWGAGYFPDVPLVTHEGETVRFFTDLIEDKVVAINFIYVTCPDACPMETARLREVADLLGDRMGDDVHFYSITIDPENDTPEVLAQHVANWRIGPGWTFLTGDEDDIVRLRKKLGLYIEEIQGEDSQDHNLSLIVGNQKTGRWMKRSPFENPYILATQLGSWLHNWKLPGEGGRDYEDAPELRRISDGELLFRTRCASCHTIGGGDLNEVATRQVGPDLLHVTDQRDRAWLERWLAEPDVMLAEGDPLAVALRERFNGVPMPNLRLTPVDVTRLISYMEEESARVNALLRQRHEEAAVAGGHEEEQGHGGHGAHGDHHGEHEGHG